MADNNLANQFTMYDKSYQSKKKMVIAIILEKFAYYCTISTLGQWLGKWLLPYTMHVDL